MGTKVTIVNLSKTTTFDNIENLSWFEINQKIYLKIADNMSVCFSSSIRPRFEPIQLSQVVNIIDGVEIKAYLYQGI